MFKLKKINFKKKYLFLPLGAIALVAGIFNYQTYSKEQAAREEVVETFEEGLSLKCENGDWIEFPKLENPGQYEKFSDNEKLKYDEKKDALTGADGGRIFSTDEEYSLLFFMDRDTRVEGYKISDDEFYVEKIKCVGMEADQNVLQSRRKLMNYIKANINALALEKARKNDWQVETFYFVNDTDVYVQYESESSFMEDSLYDSHLWLIRTTKLDRNVPLIETLAYIQEDAEDPEKNIVKQGEDLYEDVKNLIIYEFDEEANQWILQ